MEDGESFEVAARRELIEETGWVAEIGACVWVREHRYEFEGRPFHQYERFFVAHVAEAEPRAQHPDGYVTGWRWWSEADLAASTAIFAPRRFVRHIGPLLRGAAFEAPIDVGP